MHPRKATMAQKQKQNKSSSSLSRRITRRKQQLRNAPIHPIHRTLTTTSRYNAIINRHQPLLDSSNNRKQPTFPRTPITTTTAKRHVSFHPPGEPELGEVYQSIRAKLHGAIPNIAYMDVQNESNQHSGPPHRESHFKITVIAPFTTEMTPPLKMLISRHRFVNSLLNDEIKEGVHALSLHLFTLDEFTRRGETIPTSPGCISKQPTKMDKAVV